MISATAVRLITAAAIILALCALQRICKKAAAEQRRRERLKDYLDTVRRRSNNGRP